MNSNTILTRLYKWRFKNISSRNFILLLSVIIGICVGFAAFTLKTIVHFITNQLTGWFSQDAANYFYFAYPLIGIILTVLFKVYLNKDRLGAGIPNLLYGIAKKSSLVPKDQVYSHVVSSGLTVGFGGSVGLEAPIVTTGAAIGSNLGRLFHVGYKKRTLLIGCGAAAAIAGIFEAPIAGVLFTLEVLLLELTVPAFIPLLISAVTGALVPIIIGGKQVIFSFQLTETFDYVDIPFYILLGLLSGLTSVYFHRNLQIAKGIINRVKNIWGKAIIGSLSLGLLIFVFPPLYGEGYETINLLLASKSSVMLESSMFFQEISNQWFILAFAIMLVLVKVFATGFTMAAGGNGGVFAPTMFVGAINGFIVAKFFNLLNILPRTLSEKNFVMVGMAGVIAGLMHAPLTSIFLIAEVTGGYALIIPLMLVTAIAYATSRYFEKLSHYTSELAQKGAIHFHDKDKTVLNIMKMDKLIETEFTKVKIDGDLHSLTEALTCSKRNIYPVVDDKDNFYGVVTLDDFREIMFKNDLLHKVKVKDILHRPIHTVTYNETMEEVMKKFDESGYWNLPVVDGTRYVGFLSKSKIFNHYRVLLKKDNETDSNIID